MKNVVTFSGWGQNHDALENIVSGAKHINYKNFNNIDGMFESIKDIECDVLIGWSLGGQLALRAIDNKILKPKLLVLLSTPFQFVSKPSLRCGIKAETFNTFKDDLIHDSIKTLQKFSALIAKGDKNAKSIATKLKNSDKNEAQKWLYWLEELRIFSCSTIGYSRLPKTLAIIGKNDNVVNAVQIDLFRPLIKNFNPYVFDKCCHAPHLHDQKRVMQLIQESL